MKKRVVFVDDDPIVLQGLQRMLRPMRDRWEMVFTETGAKALASMAEQSCDVIVSDMRMPGMNGAELLNEVMRIHPQTVRLILSGHADKEMILKCVGAAHQFLAKPCNPDMLLDTVERASNPETALGNECIRKLVCQLNRLPSVPLLYSEIVAELNQSDSAIEEVSRIIEKDISMTAKILKLVNSAFFGLSRHIINPREAVAYLGLDTIRSLALTIQAFSQYEKVSLDGLTLEFVWSHSLNTAARARSIALIEGADRRFADEAFTAALLHDLGKLILAESLTKEYGEVIHLARVERIEMHTAEERVLGANHADAGGLLLGLWGLPLTIVDAIALHHTPARSPVLSFSPLTCVHVANALERGRGDNRVGAPLPQLDLNYLAAAGLLERLPVWAQQSETKV